MFGSLLGAGMGGAFGGASASRPKNGFDFMRFLKGSDASGTPNWLSALGTAGAIYDGYQRQKLANKALQYQKEAFDFNKMLSQRELNRQNQAEQNLYNAWNSSAFGRKKEEEQ